MVLDFWIGVLARVMAVVAIVSLALALTSCDPSSSSPSDSLGSYSTVGTLTKNTCGSGLGAEDPWSFTAQLSLDGKTLYLDTSDDTNGSSGVVGNVDSDNGTTATLTSVITTNVDPDANGMAGPCNLTLATSYELVLNDASASKSFTGSVTFDFSAATGVSSTTDCTDQLASQGGKYATLPCTAKYTLKATRQ